LNEIPIHWLMFLTTGWERYSGILISLESILYKDQFSRFMDFRESLTLAMLQSGLNTLYITFFRVFAFDSITRTPNLSMKGKHSVTTSQKVMVVIKLPPSCFRCRRVEHFIP
jgi:hypothetical protein